MCTVYHASCACVKWYEKSHIAVQTAQCVLYTQCWTVIYNGNREAKPTENLSPNFFSLPLHCIWHDFARWHFSIRYYERHFLVCLMQSVRNYVIWYVVWAINEPCQTFWCNRKRFLIELLASTTSVCRLRQMKWYKTILQIETSHEFVRIFNFLFALNH